MLKSLFGCFGRRDDLGLASTYSIIKKVGYGVGEWPRRESVPPDVIWCG